MLSKRVTVTCLLISSIILAAAAAINAQAQTLAAARILSSDGPVEIQRRERGEAALTKIAYKVNDELLAGDVIRTAKGGRLVLGLTDGSQAIIGEQTTVEIMNLSQSPRTIFNVLRGRTRIKIEKVGGRPNPYRVNTPTTVIAVRGTLFDVLVSEEETQVFVHEGKVAVSNLTTPDAFVLLSHGQQTRVRPFQPPDAPSRFQPGRNNETFRPPAGNDADAGPRAGHDPRSTDPHRPPQDATGPARNRPGGGPNEDAQPGGRPNHEGQKRP